MIELLVEDFTIEPQQRIMTELLNTTGKRVERLRKDRGWRQADLAEAAKVRQNYISAIEKDTAAPSAEIMGAIAKALGTTLDFLMMLTNNPELPGDNEPTFLTEEAEKAAKTVDALPGDARTKLLAKISAYEQNYWNLVAHKRKLNQILESVERRWGDEARDAVLEYFRVGAQAIIDQRITGDQSGDVFNGLTE